MEYCVKRIKSRDEIEQCNRFDVNNFMWNSKKEPKTYGWMGYVEDEGFFIKMVCEEKDPKRTYTKPQDPVYIDSAMEIFLAFLEDGEELSNDCMYTNFEINSLGAMLANFGKGRNDRKQITEEQYKATGVKSVIEDDKWYLEVLYPLDYLRTVCDIDKVIAGKDFYCNFYKIAEGDEIEHYGSFSSIESEKPNFHMPICFAKAHVE